jgi:hypothetical protein
MTLFKCKVYMAWKCRMIVNEELERMWPWTIFKYYRGGTEESHENFSLSPIQYSNSEPSEEVLPGGEGGGESKVKEMINTL